MQGNALLAEIVKDFADLRLAYVKAGLLNDSSPDSVAWKLLGGAEHIDRFRRDVLLLDALIRNRVARTFLDGGSHRHIAVFGGNNVGKSTVVNILSKGPVASSSPEGGHTRCSQVFTVTAGSLFGQNQYAFRDFSAVSGKPANGRLDCYGISLINTDALPVDVALWDTPDCDAVGSGDYLASVVEALAAADAMLYVTSVEKYAVEHLVEWLFHLSDAGTKIVECLNKTPKRDRETVIRKQNTDVFGTISKRLGLNAPEMNIVALRNMTEGEEDDLWGPDHPEAEHLRSAVLSCLSTTDRSAAARAALMFVIKHLDRALEPVRMECEAWERWASAVDNATSEFIASYERGYLTSDTVIEPISRLNLEILNLLDPNIPGLKVATVALRWVTRLPSKLILGAGRIVFKLLFRNSGADDGTKLAPELKVYSDSHTWLLNTLSRRIDEERRATRHHPFWDALAEEYRDKMPTLTEKFGVEVESHMKRTDEEIKTAAKDILEKLKQSPNTLNALRGLRVSADVGGALVGFFIPGTGDLVYDLLEELIVAPALLGAADAVTKAIAESYIVNRKAKIVDKLKEEARSMATSVYRDPLLAIALVPMARIGTLGVDKAILSRLPERLDRLRTELP